MEMDSEWSQLREEAVTLAREIGNSGREHHTLIKSADLLEHIRTEGVPVEHREWTWPILLHNECQRLRRECTNFNSYADLLNELEKDHEIIESKDLDQAQELAIERFEHLNPFQERKIKRIMLAYSKSKPVFFYCHGMVEICVVLSTFLSEEDSFWIFKLLIEVLLPKYYEESVLGFHTDCLVLQELLDIHDASLSQHFADMGVSIQLLCTKWFFSLFAETMPFQVVCRLYDILFADICELCKGSRLILSTSLAICLYLSDTLLEMNDASLMLDLMQEFCGIILGEYSVAESFLDLVLFVNQELVTEDKVRELRERFHDQLSRTNSQYQDEQAASVSPSKKVTLVLKWNQNEQPDKSEATVSTRAASGEVDGEEAEEDVDSAIPQVAVTPSQRQMLLKLNKDIEKVNRRRSRSSSMSLRHLPVLSVTSPERNQSRTDLSSTKSSCDGLDGSMNLSFASFSIPAVPDERRWLELREEREEFCRNMTVCIPPVWLEEFQLTCFHYGIPEMHRSWAWHVLLFDQALGVEVDKESESKLLDKEVQMAIDNDLNRTRNLSREEDKAQMRKLLTAFARRNRRVGYCQGMNEIAAVLLKYFDDEHEAFGALVILIETLLPAYHVDSMIGLHIDCAVVNSLLKQNDQQLHAHLDDMGLNMEILCTKWLVTLFLTCFSSLRLLDMLFALRKEKQSASRVILGVCFALFETNRAELLDCQEPGDVLMEFQTFFSSRLLDPDDADTEKFWSFCIELIQQLNPDEVELLRIAHKDEVMEKFATFEAKKIEMRLQQQATSARRSPTSSPVPKRTGSPARSRRRTSRSSPGQSNGLGTSKSHRPSPPGNRKMVLTNYLGITTDDSNYEPLSISDVEVIKNGKTSINQGSTQDAVAFNSAGPWGLQLPPGLDQMEDQLEEVGGLLLSGKIDEKEHSCIKEQIVRNYCKSINSPQSVVERVHYVKQRYQMPSSNELALVEIGARGADAEPPSFLSRMKRIKKNALKILKSF